jgi:hypothetical protein
MEFAKSAGEKIMHPPADWKIFNENRPISWGNDGMWTDPVLRPRFEDVFDSMKAPKCVDESEFSRSGAICAVGNWPGQGQVNKAWLLLTPAQISRLNKK